MKGILGKIIYAHLKLFAVITFFLPLLFWGTNLVNLSRDRLVHTLESKERSEKADNFAKEQIALHISPVTASINSVVAQNSVSTENKKQEIEADKSGENNVKGIDVSHYQGTINWDKVASDGVKFTYIKATGGKGFIDPEFKKNWNGSRESGLSRGAYHFFYAAEDPIEQAKHFLNVVGEFKRNDLPPVLDVEITDHIDTENLRTRVLDWLKYVHEKTGKRPVIYSDIAFLDEHLNSTKLSEYPLWVADYQQSLGSLPISWQHAGWYIWQHGQGNIQGIDGSVDLNIFNGSINAVDAFIFQAHENHNVH